MSNNSKKYSVTAIINGETYKKQTNNVQETLMELKPEFVLTEMYVTVKNGKQVSERRMTAQQGKKFYSDEIFREVFMNNLLLT